MNIDIADRTKRLLQILRLSYEEYSDQLNRKYPQLKMSKGKVSEIVNKKRIPRITYIIAIMEVFGVHLLWLFSERTDDNYQSGKINSEVEQLRIELKNKEKEIERKQVIEEIEIKLRILKTI